ncbi:MAG: threonine--tRNA ligase [Bacillota bacterium]|jgi:threonyl-tRNA synthetase|nr:threonine--tRNA ligase [Candidatus Fermentithermobacillaceae bacterium]
MGHETKEGFVVKWNDQSGRFIKGSAFLDVKKAFGWKNDVLMVQIADEAQPQVLELREAVDRDCVVEPLGFEDEKAREALRHTASHVLAQAVKRLFPGTRLGIGPAIEDGFYYDFDTEHRFSQEDLADIEKEMKRIVKQNLPITREIMSREEARRVFEEAGEPYKVELIDELPEGEQISIYRQGEFFDLCAGPHVPYTGYLKAFKLLSVAGAYWRGDENRPMLQRIYGTSFMDKEALDAHLARLEEIKRRDHRRLGRELGLFSIEEEGGPGLVYWHPKGAMVREVIENFWKEEHRKRGYEIVYTPHIAKLDLWKVSGHWDWYSQNMYSPMDVDDAKYLLKPMNCPFHILIYKGKTRSYRDLPIKYGELGTVYRYERSGVLHGMLRVRGFTQDDAHVFCRPDQLEEQLVEVLDLAEFMLKTFGYDEYYCMLSVRDPENKESYIGDDEIWEQAEAALENALKAKNLDYQVDVGEAKFYGPAIDINIKDTMGRMWQGPTIQADLNLPERFDIHYIGEDGQKHRPVMIHRTVLGAMERFIGGLIEHYAGAFPMWLSPVQIRVMPVSDKHSDYAKVVAEHLEKQGLRTECDLGQDKIGYKIRQAQLEKVPYMIIVGDKEKQAGNISVRHRSLGDLGPMGLDEFASKAKHEVSSKSLESVFAQS